MAVTNWIALLLTHPFEFRTLIQFYLYHEQKRDIAAQKEHPTSGWDRQSMRRCWEFLDMTSRSFSAVIKEVEGDLARTVSADACNTRVQCAATNSGSCDLARLVSSLEPSPEVP